MASMMVSRHTVWLKCYPQNFYSLGSICESNIFLLKSQTLYEPLPYNIPEVFNKTGHGLIIWSNCLVVKALDSQSRGPVFKTTEWLQG